MAAPVTTSSILSQSDFDVVFAFTASFTDTQESAAIKVDASTLTNVHPSITPKPSIESVYYNCQGSGRVNILFDATSDVLALQLAGTGTLDFSSAPLQNNAGAGVTGDILFTTSGFTSGQTYQIIIKCRKEPATFTTAPVMTNFTFTDDKSGVYETGDDIELEATFNQPVNVHYSYLPITLGSGVIVLRAVQTAPNKLAFAHTVTADDTAEATEFVVGELYGVNGTNIGQLPLVNTLTINTAAFTVNQE